MLYGYSTKTLNEYGLQDLREITIAADSKTLRQIAEFLKDMADEMDAGGFERCSHKHIDGYIDGWSSRCPERDVIVMPAVPPEN